MKLAGKIVVNVQIVDGATGRTKLLTMHETEPRRTITFDAWSMLGRMRTLIATYVSTVLFAELMLIQSTIYESCPT